MNSMNAYYDLGLALGRTGRWEEARPWLESAWALAERVQGDWRQSGLATAHLECGDPEAALSRAREEASRTLRSGHRYLELRLRIELAEVAARCGEEAEARAALARARELAASTECRLLVPAIHEAAAVLAASLRNTEQHRAELHQALQLYRELGATGHAERLERELGTTGSGG
jgi:tetratricopeptide (TPR) repeat protein